MSCIVETSAATTFVCLLPAGGEAGAHDLFLRVPGYGFAPYAGAAQTVTYPLTLTAGPSNP